MKLPARDAGKHRLPAMRAVMMQEVSYRSDAAFTGRLSFALGRQLQPIALVHKRDGQQEDAQDNEADDAVGTIELGDVVDEDFHDGDGNQDQSLPADEGATAK